MALQKTGGVKEKKEMMGDESRDNSEFQTLRSLFKKLQNDL